MLVRNQFLIRSYHSKNHPMQYFENHHFLKALSFNITPLRKSKKGSVVQAKIKAEYNIQIGDANSCIRHRD